MVDLDGSVEYSNIVSGMVNGKETTNIMIFPNPAKDRLYLNTTTFEPNQAINILIFDQTGKTVLVQQEISDTSLDLDISSLPKGTYFIKIDGSEAQQFIIE